ncbi:MAG: ROK family transcriptional regulator [Firmicutes bacterium]|nr:ROK family transcriptional regulator [Bacillota bacterium]
MVIKNQSEMKDGNIRNILRTMLWNAPISRADLCKKTGLTPSAVSALIRELLEIRVIQELGPDSQKNQGVGRPPSLLQLRANSYAAAGAEIGANYLSLGVLDLTGEMQDTMIEKIAPGEQPESVFDQITCYVAKQDSQLKEKRAKLVGLGVAVTGLVDTKRGINRFAPNLGWRDINVTEELSSRLSIPVVVDNNVRLMALGEQWFGNARDSGGLIFVQVGAGVGCGIVLPGIGLLRGAFDGGGELGHCTVLPGGPVCKCGKQGCLEALISERALVSAYLRRTAIHSETAGDPRSLSVDTIVEAANQGDIDATSVLREAAEFLGIGLATLVNILEPSQIVLNGNAFALSPLTRTWICESTQRHRFSSEENIELSDATFKGHQGMVGAATAALQQEIF